MTGLELLVAAVISTTAFYFFVVGLCFLVTGKTPFD